MSLEAYWRRFGYCDECGAYEMRPCLDMRYARYNRSFFTDKAHRTRPLIRPVPEPKD